MTGQPRAVRVVQARWESDGVVSLRLRASDGEPLPRWEPGAHVDLVLPSGLVRQYSLCGPSDSDEYTIAVLREENGRGGSAEVHDTALVGRELSIRGPRNRFDLEPAPAYVFVAGGIGITPLLAMIRKVAGRGVPWELHYGGRRRDTLAFTHELAELAERRGGGVHLYSDDAEGPLPLPRIVAGAPDGAMLYACGPGGMLTALADTVQRERPRLPLRFERFTAALAEPAPDQGGAPFEVELARTGATVTVQPGQSILEAVRAEQPDVLYSCEEGFCGTCETKVLEGVPIHKDTILSDKEREKNTTMMICVGGCASARLVLDL
ncbi:PDR/VanB family oxidoreductase [Amycolatopsis thermophila]|uniref:Ferredoxin-NADP reductase n=1 Tax=Amycolatopsis thermophila TaxID=206084 RepID=A0ABU0F7M9_9PSEU|nr:PDR/VanB family oxidoreductase [Amycolatopsis thermophila]MDQ0383032.1 ferredoxin-NADP reductase [Amycolatopsis thermophila]